MSFLDCLELHKLTVFSAGAAEKQRFFKIIVPIVLSFLTNGDGNGGNNLADGDEKDKEIGNGSKWDEEDDDNDDWYEQDDDNEDSDGDDDGDGNNNNNGDDSDDCDEDDAENDSSDGKQQGKQQRREGNPSVESLLC